MLAHGSVTPPDGVASVDQGAIRGSRRSNPATYSGLLDPIRMAFAKATGVKPTLFSANSDGACPAACRRHRLRYYWRIQIPGRRGSARGRRRGRRTSNITAVGLHDDAAVPLQRIRQQCRKFG
jgi:hypothetical protein